MGEPFDELPGVGLASGALDLLGSGVGPSVGDILPDGAVEEHGLLRNVGNLPTQAGLGHVRDVLPVDEDAAAREVLETEQQRRERGLARAGAAHEAHALAAGDAERKAVEDAVVLLGTGIAKTCILETNGSLAHM